MKAPFALEIPRRSQLCSHGQENLIPGSEYISVLFQNNKELYERNDYCLACWEKIADEKMKDSEIQWKSRLPTKQEKNLKAQFKNRNEKALHLLKEALNQKDEAGINESFVLALFLARNRQLALRQEVKQENGQPFFLYEILATEEMIAIPRLQLSDIQTEKIQQELAKKFA